MERKLLGYEEISCKYTKDILKDYADYIYLLKKRIDLKDAQIHGLEIRLKQSTMWLSRLEDKIKLVGEKNDSKKNGRKSGG